MNENNITISQSLVSQAATDGDVEQIADHIVNEMQKRYGEELTAEAMQQLSAAQITLWGYHILRDEVMDGGFVQLIYNGYGPFFFDNPFAKAMRWWGLRDFSKLIYKAKEIYDQNKDELTRERTDEEFMAMFEAYPQFDDLDNEFVEEEEYITKSIASYVQMHLSDFAQII